MTPHKSIVVALGGNAISPLEEEGNIAQQFTQTRQSVKGLANLIDAGYLPVITHGNGPQVGNAIRRVELSSDQVYPLDLGICVADLQGGMGYMIAQCLMNELHDRGNDRIVSTIVTTVMLDRSDPAFNNPTKPIGSLLDKEQAEGNILKLGWQVREVPGKPGFYRRVVPSPHPKRIMEIDLIRRLVQAGELIVCVGGGGIPVIRDEQDWLGGVEAVIDKDLASSLLARELGVDTLMILTAEPKICLDFGKPTQRPIDRMTVREAKRHLEDGQFPPGSMGPKIRAAIEFIDESTVPNPRAIVTDLTNLTDALEGKTGSMIVSDDAA